MFKNYLKTAFRNLLKSKFYTSLNIIGLAAGLATCLLIMLYVMDELSYDKFNVNAGRIYRVNNEVKFGDNHFDMAVSPALLGSTMVREFPEVQQYTRLRWYGSFRVKKGSENIQEDRIGFADSTLFDVFTLPVIDGDPKTALTEPHSLVITEKIAMKYFNTTQAAGRTMLINDTGNYKVTAVIKNIPAQSHFNFNIFVPMRESDGANDDNWLSENWNTYILLKKNADAKRLESQLNPFMEKHTAPLLKTVINQSMEEFTKGGGYVRASLTPLTAIHLHSNKMAEIDANGNAQFVYIFTAIALLILLIACVNFMNLSTARSSKRAKEVGIRKVLGSYKKHLVLQFLTESFLISFIAMICSLLIAALLLPYFNQLSGKTITVSTLFQPKIMVLLFVLIIVVGLVAGSYPAFFLSSFQPIKVLKGTLAGGFKRSWLRNSLVVFQFTVSIILIFGTLVIYNQLNYIYCKDIGFNRGQVITIDNTSSLGDKAITFKQELLRISAVKNATLSGYLPVNFNRSNDAFFTSPALDQKTAISMQNWFVDEDYIPTLGMKILEGRNFSKEYGTDSSGIIINEAAAKFLATKDLLNKKLYNFKDINTKALNEYHIIGVIKNFNFSSLRDVITPLAFKLGQDNGNISVRIASSDVEHVIEQIKNKWQSMAPGQPFSYTFMDEDFNNLYNSEQRTARIFISFAVLAILIACLGLFGLITYAAEQRVKEIGIRKVLGASVGNISGMLSKDFLKLVLISAAIAFPVAWWAMHKWLEDFAYRVPISWWIFVVAGILALIIALATVSFQAIKAALANPVKSLRTE
ncbi:MAG TPA: FtsX-like permease family protein [Parafilimonas sp.]|nr:FtsX-like permease family protein [Parafilimonas sp.]